MRSPTGVLRALITYGLLAGAATTAYCAVLITVGLATGRPALPGPWWGHVVAAAVVAASVEPARRWFRLGVDDVLAGHHDPYAAVTALHHQVEAGTDPAVSLARTLARALDVPCLRVVVRGEPVEAFGSPPPGTVAVAVPVRYGGEQLGEVLAWPRRPGSLLPGGDVGLLRDLADQVALGLVARRAAAAAQTSRAELVAAREEERRRLRRDLHDGLGPTLASLRLQLSAVARLLPEGADAAAAGVTDLLDGVRSATRDVRRIVDDLRPALLDDLGLAGALGESAAACSGVVVSVTIEGDLAALPAAVEVAAHRIAGEALHNISRHAGARTASVALDVHGDLLSLVVSDDGRGLPHPLVAGVGLGAMRERAEELGGTLAVARALPHGTQVTAHLPLRGGAC